MGNKTFLSIGRPLPNRTNIILSHERRPNEGPIQFDDPLLWAGNREAALYLADLISITSEKSDFFVIGGQEIYRLFLEDDLINKVYLTEVFAKVRGDAFFDYKFTKEKWRLALEQDFSANDQDDYSSRFMIYERRERKYRRRWLSGFFTDKLSRTSWVEQYLRAHQREVASYENTHQLEMFGN